MRRRLLALSELLASPEPLRHRGFIDFVRVGK